MLREEGDGVKLVGLRRSLVSDLAKVGAVIATAKTDSRHTLTGLAAGGPDLSLSLCGQCTGEQRWAGRTSA